MEFAGAFGIKGAAHQVAEQTFGIPLAARGRAAFDDAEAVNGFFLVRHHGRHVFLALTDEGVEVGFDLADFVDDPGQRLPVALFDKGGS